MANTALVALVPFIYIGATANYNIKVDQSVGQTKINVPSGLATTLNGLGFTMDDPGTSGN